MEVLEGGLVWYFNYFIWGVLGAYILKVGYAGYKNPQMILNFPQSYWLSFPLFMFSHCNKLSIKTLKHTIFSTKMPHWHQILVIFMIYALLSQNFAVRIYALFPQIFGDWNVESADFFTFRMYGSMIMITQASLLVLLSLKSVTASPVSIVNKLFFVNAHYLWRKYIRKWK